MDSGQWTVDSGIGNWVIASLFLSVFTCVNRCPTFYHRGLLPSWGQSSRELCHPQGANEHDGDDAIGLVSRLLKLLVQGRDLLLVG